MKLDKRMTRLFLLAGTLTAAAAASAIDVAYDGGDPAVGFAAQDLVRLLKDVPGRIVLREEAGLARQEWRFRSAADGSLVISGCDGMGIVYGVYVFLERKAGVSWLAPDTEIVPDFGGWTLPQLDERGRPAYSYREMYVGLKDRMDDYWRMRNRESYRAAFGLNVRFGTPGDCHTFDSYARKIKVRHPELFRRRMTPKGNVCQTLCMTDPLMRRLVAEEMIANIEKDAADCAGKPPYIRPTLYDLSQDDGPSGYECWCDGCRALMEKEGSYAGPVVSFASAVADLVCAKHPEIRVRTFAYSYSSEPPKTVVASSNVVIRFCGSRFGQPLTPETDNGRRLMAWNAHASSLALWSYWRTHKGTLDPCVMPRAQIANDLRFAFERGVTSYFAEDEDPLNRNFAMLQHWLFLRLAEDPYQDSKALTIRFLTGYYGKAARPMGLLLKLLEDSQEDTREFLNRAYFERANGLLDEAERLVSGDARSLRHVHWERVVTDRAMYNYLGRLQRQGYRPDLKRIAERFAANAREQLENWPSLADRGGRLEAAANESALYSHYPVEIPAQFAGREVEDMQWTQIPLTASHWEGRKAETVYVDDPDAVAGRAFYNGRLVPKFPLKVGVNNDSKKEGAQLQLKPEDVPQDEKFHLYRVGRAVIQSPLYIYFDDTWLFRHYFGTLGVVPETRDVWVSMKVTGPTFVRGSKRPDRVLFDRILLVK